MFLHGFRYSTTFFFCGLAVTYYGVLFRLGTLTRLVFLRLGWPFQIFPLLSSSWKQQLILPRFLIIFVSCCAISANVFLYSIILKCRIPLLSLGTILQSIIRSFSWSITTFCFCLVVEFVSIYIHIHTLVPNNLIHRPFSVLVIILLPVETTKIKFYPFCFQESCIG